MPDKELEDVLGAIHKIKGSSPEFMGDCVTKSSASLLFAYNANENKTWRSDATEDGTEPVSAIQGVCLWESFL
jgi:hypothetical protein